MAFHYKIKQFLQLESSSAVILLAMAVLAMVLANSPLSFLHQRFIDSFLFWINEGLMAVFFLIIGLELKRYYLEGQLNYSHVLLPAFAALGGMIVPGLIYCLFNINHPHTLKGWAAPVATDIAFSLGILSLFGKKVPISLKLFLLMLAIFDDIGAIVIIAIFYTHKMVYLWLAGSFVVFFLLLMLNFLSVKRLFPYILLGVLLWNTFLNAGIHPTLAGVLLALTIPDMQRKTVSPLYRLENLLHPYVAFFIMPLFALANAGISLQGLSFDFFSSVVVLGIVFGLFIGKQLGVFIFSWVLIRLRLVTLPKAVSWTAFYGVALLCGIGFTMSLFLGTLAFERAETYLIQVRLGVIIGSLLSGIFGAFILWIAFNKEKPVYKRRHAVG